jgi:Domain of unknown function (DUF4288)
MAWYTASIVTAIKRTDTNEQETYPVFEDFYLIEADNRHLAAKKAQEIGLGLEELNDGLELQGRAARREFLGVRKIRSISNPLYGDVDAPEPVDGTELSHSYFEISNKEDLTGMAQGKRVRVEYVDDDE